MNKNLNFIPRKLNLVNIDKAISDYKDSINSIPFSINSNDILSFLTSIKREKLKVGPYPEVSLFEAANRIMTDLTILFGVKYLLNGAILELDFAEYTVEFGNENKNDHDLMACNGRKRLIGEAFNVSESYFYTKKSFALKKLNKSVETNQIKLLLFNSEAKANHLNPKISENEFHFPVKFTLL